MAETGIEPVYYELSWSILSTICIANVLFGGLVIGITTFSPIATVPIFTSIAGAIANGLCYYAFYNESYSDNSQAIASVFADLGWLVSVALFICRSWSLLIELSADPRSWLLLLQLHHSQPSPARCQTQSLHIRLLGPNRLHHCRTRHDCGQQGQDDSGWRRQLAATHQLPPHHLLCPHRRHRVLQFLLPSQHIRNCEAHVAQGCFGHRLVPPLDAQH